MPGMRPVYKSYLKGLEFRRSAASWSDEQKLDWTLGQIRRCARRAAAVSPYYSGLFKEAGFDPTSNFTFGEYAKLPVLSRETIHDQGSQMVATDIPATRLLKDATGGSTGAPTEIFLGPEERGWKESGSEYQFGQIGVPRGTRTAYFWGHHLDPNASDSLRTRIRSRLLNESWHDCFRLGPDVFEKYHAEFTVRRPDCMVAYAGALGEFAEYLLERGIEVRDYPGTCFVTGAEKLDPKHRVAIERVFGKPVHERYGGRDFGTIAFQLEPQINHEFTVDWAWAMIEPESEGPESNVLVTKLHADGMPMLRYRIGDIARFQDEDRPGHPSLRLREVIGRTLDRIWLPSGNWVHGTEFPHMLKDFSVREFVIIQNEDLGLEIRLIPKPGFTDTERSRILETVRSNVEGLEVRIDLVDHIERTKANKLRPVISKVKRD